MTKKNSDKNTARRRLIKSAIAGGGVLATGKLLPENWVAPVVRPVVLPAHAQTSPGGGLVTGNFATPAAEIGVSNNPAPSILDQFVSPAYAQTGYTLGTQVVFQAQWTVNENDADLCLNARVNTSFISATNTVNRNGNKLATSKFAGGQFVISNQKVSESGVSFTASALKIDDTFNAPPGIIKCSSFNVTTLNGSSSPYGADEEIV